MTKFVWHRQEIINMLERQNVTYSLPPTFSKDIVHIFIFKNGRRFRFTLFDNVLTCNFIDDWLPEFETYAYSKSPSQQLADIKHLYFFLRKWGVINESTI